MRTPQERLRCDRCGKEDTVGEVGYVPTGSISMVIHQTRVDSDHVVRRDICKSCTLSFNDWFRAGKP